MQEKKAAATDVSAAKAAEEAAWDAARDFLLSYSAAEAATAAVDAAAAAARPALPRRKPSAVIVLDMASDSAGDSDLKLISPAVSGDEASKPQHARDAAAAWSALRGGSGDDMRLVFRALPADQEQGITIQEARSRLTPLCPRASPAPIIFCTRKLGVA